MYRRFTSCKYNTTHLSWDNHQDVGVRKKIGVRKEYPEYIIFYINGVLPRTDFVYRFYEYDD